MSISPTNVKKTVVQRVSDRNIKGTTYFSFKGQDDIWYGTKQTKPPAAGTYVQFEASQNGRGYWEASNLVVIDQPKEEATSGANVALAAVGAAKKPARNSEAYWANREDRDVEVQRRIELQSCRNSALALVSTILQNEVVKKPKQADQEEFVLALVDRYTRLFFDNNTTFFTGETKKIDTPVNDGPAGRGNNTKTQAAPADESEDSPDKTEWA